PSAARAQGETAPAPVLIVLPPLAQGSATTPTPGPAAAEPTSKDIFLPDGGKGPPLATPPAKKGRFPLEASWDNGFHFDSPDDHFHVAVGGIVHLDSVGLTGPQSVFALPGGGSNGVGNADATQIRRAILQADGNIYGLFDYVVAFDFANASNDNS